MKKTAETHLNQRGIAHIILPLLVIVVIGIGGAFLLVSSNAATDRSAKKTRVKLVVSTAKINTENVAHIEVELRTKKGQPVSQDTCSGGVDIVLTERNGTVISRALNSDGSPSLYGAQWVDGRCIFAMSSQSLTSKKGNARANVVYHGSAEYGSAKKSFSVKRVKAPKSGDLGPVIVAPAQ